jgi:hypothetical protein
LTCCLIVFLAHPLLIGAPTVPAHPYNLDQLISEDGTVTIEQLIMSAEEATIYHFLLSSSASATRTGQTSPLCTISGASWFVVSCVVRLSEVGLSEIHKTQVGRDFRRAKLVPNHHDTPMTHGEVHNQESSASADDSSC